MGHRSYSVLAALFLLLFPHPAFAQPEKSIIDDTLVAEAQKWMSAPVVEIALNAQKRRYTGINQADIDRLDQQWRSEREQQSQPLIASTLNNPLSTYLTQIQALSNGLYTEIFVIDVNGLNAGQSSITSDFWQGDEAKFQKTFDVGPDAVFVDEPEFNDATQTWRAQLNMTLVGEGGDQIGVATLEINLTELARRRGQ
jgi:hypothetical protein